MKHAATLQWKGIGVLCNQNKVPKVHVAIINRISYVSILLKQNRNNHFDGKVTKKSCYGDESDGHSIVLFWTLKRTLTC